MDYEDHLGLFWCNHSHLMSLETAINHKSCGDVFHLGKITVLFWSEVGRYWIRHEKYGWLQRLMLYTEHEAMAVAMSILSSEVGDEAK